MTAKRRTREKQILTRRLFGIFVLFAMIPTVALSWAAIEYISNAARDQTQAALVAQSDTFSDSVLSRLAVAERRLEIFRTDLESGLQNGDSSLTDRWTEQTAPGDASIKMGVLEPAFAANQFSERQREHLARGRTLLSLLPSAHPDSNVLMIKRVRPNDPAGPVVGASITPDVVFGLSDSLDLRVENCIYDGDGNVLFSTDQTLCAPFKGFNAEYRGVTRRSWSGADYTLTYRSVFLEENFLAQNWAAGIVSADKETLRQYTVFRQSFLALSGLMLLVLSFLSIRLIRRQMAPLKNIMEGIQRVSRHDYDHPVQIESGDEFEAMADAFNTMSTRVSRQLATMGSMSEIDQLILSRGKKEDIVQIVLNKTRTVLPGDRFAVLLFDTDNPDQASLFRSERDDTTTLESVTLTTTDAERISLIDNASALYEPGTSGLPDWIQLLASEGDAGYQLLPVISDSTLIAVLIIVFHEMPDLDQEVLDLAPKFADRIAVGLSNAEWEQRLFYQANYDSLTDLPNRPALIEELQRRVIRSRREQRCFGVLFIDLDNFKLINDSLGHDSGDKLISAMADRLGSVVREGDMVARLGGDEFVVLCAESDTLDSTITAANEVANRMLEAVAQPLLLEEREVRIEASIGIALHPNDGENSATLMRNADAAMYHAKGQGRGCRQFFSEELNRASEELMTLSTELKQALERDEFVLYYQPKVCAKTCRIIGAEALIRWQHPIRGHLQPGSFIPAAEELGLMAPLGDWVLRAACSQLGRWKRDGIESVPISLNVVASQIQDQQIVESMQHLFETHQLDGTQIELEITENALVTQVADTISILNSLREMGMKISIDDYGTGYSSMSYMKLLPVDKLKIDRAFVIDLANSPADRAIVSSTVLLAHSLNMQVIAEGVEDAEQLAILHESGCDEIQGYYFSRPIPAEQLIKLIEAGSYSEKRLEA